MAPVADAAVKHAHSHVGRAVITGAHVHEPLRIPASRLGPWARIWKTLLEVMGLGLLCPVRYMQGSRLRLRCT